MFRVFHLFPIQVQISWGLSFASFAHRGEVFLKMLNLGGRASGGVEWRSTASPPSRLAPSCALYLHAVVPSWQEFCAKSQEGL